MVRSSMPVVTLRKCDDRHVKASPDELARYRSRKDRDVFRSPMTAVPFASVIVPVGGDAVRLEWVLAGLMAQTTTNFEVVVCSEAGPRSIRPVVLRFSDRLELRWRRGPKRDTGSGAARNHAVRASKGALLIFLDGHMVPDPDFVEAHVAHYSSDIAVCGYRRHFPMERGIVPRGALEIEQSCAGVLKPSAARARSRIASR